MGCVHHRGLHSPAALLGKCRHPLKACTKCKTEKSLDQFGKNRSTHDGLQHWCKACSSLYQKSYYQANSDRIKDRQRQYAASPRGSGYRKSQRRNDYLKSKYRITEADYIAMLEQQGGVCANPTCSSGPDRRSLDVDHDHACCPGQKSCGKCVRSLLCNGCNVALGGVNDSVEKLRGLIAYLAFHK
jgi:hypothetical protein